MQHMVNAFEFGACISIILHRIIHTQWREYYKENNKQRRRNKESVRARERDKSTTTGWQANRLIFMYNFILYENLVLHKCADCVPSTHTHTQFIHAYMRIAFAQKHTRTHCALVIQFQCDDACVIDRRKKESKAFDDWDYKWVPRSEHWFCALSKKHIVLLYVCTLIIWLRYHSFDFIFTARLFFGVGVYVGVYL